MIDAIAVTESLSLAARAMHISQSALSHRIREAERRVGAELVGKRNGRAFLTPAGLLLLPAAQAALAEIAQAERAIDSLSQGPGEAVRLSASTLLGYQWLPRLFSAIEAAGIDVRLQVAPDPSLDPLAALKAKLVDLAILPAPTTIGYFSFLPLFVDELVAVLPADHPKAQEAWLSARDFKDETYLANYPKRDAGHEYDRFFEPAGVVPDRLLHLGTAETCLAFVRAGKGVTILTRRSAEQYAAPFGLALVSLTPSGVAIEWNAAMRHGDMETHIGEIAQMLPAVFSDRAT